MKLSYEHYISFYKSGMFWEWFPECIGDYEHDEPIITAWLKKNAKPVPDCEYQD